LVKEVRIYPQNFACLLISAHEIIFFAFEALIMAELLPATHD